MRKTVLLCLLVGGLAYLIARSPGGAAQAQESKTLAPAPVDLSGNTIVIEKDVQFISGDKTFAVAAGRYTIEPGGADKLRLVHESGTALVLPAEASKHDLKVSGQAALCHGDPGKDRFDLALFLEDGRLLYAVGSYSGARARGDVTNPWGIVASHRMTVTQMTLSALICTYLAPEHQVVLLLRGTPIVGTATCANVRFVPDGEVAPDPTTSGTQTVLIYPRLSELGAWMEVLKLGLPVQITYAQYNNGMRSAGLSPTAYKAIPWVQ